MCFGSTVPNPNIHSVYCIRRCNILNLKISLRNLWLGKGDRGNQMNLETAGVGMGKGGISPSNKRRKRASLSSLVKRLLNSIPLPMNYGRQKLAHEIVFCQHKMCVKLQNTIWYVCAIKWYQNLTVIKYLFLIVYICVYWFTVEDEDASVTLANKTSAKSRIPKCAKLTSSKS